MTTIESRDADIGGAAPKDPDWRDQAACRGQLKLFFPPKAERPQARTRREAKAKRLCDTCPVFLECRTWARENREYGYWAGESEEDRYFLGFGVSAPIGVRVRLEREAERESA
jgi:WhiB family redox-sensing transcriptional regulator